MYKYKLKSILGMVLLTGLSSCQQSAPEIVLDNGIRMVHHLQTGKEKAQEGDFIGMRFQHRNHRDSIYQNSFDSESSSFKLTKHLFSETLQDGLKMMSVGDSASFFIPVTKLFPDQTKLPAFIREGEYVQQIVKIDYIKDAETFNAERKQKLDASRLAEDRKIEVYLKDKGLALKKNDLGFWQSGEKLNFGSEAANNMEVHYRQRIKTLDGDVLYDDFSKESSSLHVFGSGSIPSFLEALLFELPKNSNQQIILPSRLAYGSRGQARPFKVPPDAVLHYEVEVEKVQPYAPPAAENGPKK